MCFFNNTIKNSGPTILALLLAMFFTGSFCAAQDVPIEVENLFTNKGKKSFSLSFSYSDLEDNLGGETVSLIQSGSNTFNLIRIETGETDFSSATASLRYGLTKKIEIFLRSGFSYQDNRSTLEGLNKGELNSSGTRVGVNYKISEDNNTPAAFVSFEYTLIDELFGETFNGKSYQLGFFGYKAIDPLVFYVSSGYQNNLPRSIGESTFKLGDTFFIRPSVSFSVNDKVSFFGGFTWQNAQRTAVKGQVTAVRKTNTNLNLGVSYGISKKSYIQFFFDTGDSVSTNSFGVDWTYNF